MAYDKTNGLNSKSKTSSKSQNGISNTKVVGRKNKRLVTLINAKSEVYLGKVIIELPLQTKSEANCFEPWRMRHARHKEQKRVVSLALKPVVANVKLPCRVLLTRYAPVSLDEFENLPMSFKYIVDSICALITGDYRPGRADADKRIKLACAQVKSKAYGIRIEISWD
ncbi:MAG TPA: hypothetical protein VK787_01865 [Puia sp.]|nr:hypothetical protein [Puia sp.]